METICSTHRGGFHYGRQVGGPAEAQLHHNQAVPSVRMHLTYRRPTSMSLMGATPNNRIRLPVAHRQMRHVWLDEAIDREGFLHRIGYLRHQGSRRSSDIKMI